MRLSTKKIAMCGILTALSLIAFILENLLPPIFLPGAKIGLSNVFILITAIFCGGTYAVFALIIKCGLGSVFAGNVSAILYSLPAGALSLTIELLLLFFAKKVSVIAISVCGAVVNATIQNVTFCLITNSYEYLIYLPYISLIAVVAGIIVGLIVYFTVRYLKIPTVSQKREKDNLSK